MDSAANTRILANTEYWVVYPQLADNPIVSNSR
jgi:hypothetical protein